MRVWSSTTSRVTFQGGRIAQFANKPQAPFEVRQSREVWHITCGPYWALPDPRGEGHKYLLIMARR
eukprot:5946562-Prorocentrum_lima.AAC.1